MAENPDNPSSQPSPDPQAGGDEAQSSQASQPSDSSERVAASEPTAEQVAEQSLESAAMAAEQIKAANDAGSSAAASSDAAGRDGKAAAVMDLPNFDAAAANGTAAGSDLGMLNDIDLNVKIELGRTRMYIEDVLRLNANSIVELDKAAGDPVDIYVNDRHVARGEVLVLSENFCVRVSEIIQQPEGE